MRERTQKTAFTLCTEEGNYRPVAAVNVEQIHTMYTIALVDWETLRIWKERAPQKSGQWNALYKLGYDVLHTLCEAFLLFDSTKARTHECVFAYLCEHYPAL